jgi:hypothetical protein
MTVWKVKGKSTALLQGDMMEEIFMDTTIWNVALKTPAQLYQFICPVFCYSKV